MFLRGDESLIEHRQAARHHHYMPSSLVRSQFEALEPPGPDENPLTVDVTPAPQDIARAIVDRLA